MKDFNIATEMFANEKEMSCLFLDEEKVSKDEFSMALEQNKFVDITYMYPYTIKNIDYLNIDNLNYINEKEDKVIFRFKDGSKTEIKKESLSKNAIKEIWEEIEKKDETKFKELSLKSKYGS